MLLGGSSSDAIKFLNSVFEHATLLGSALEAIQFHQGLDGTFTMSRLIADDHRSLVVLKGCSGNFCCRGTELTDHDHQGAIVNSAGIFILQNLLLFGVILNLDDRALRDKQSRKGNRLWKNPPSIFAQIQGNAFDLLRVQPLEQLGGVRGDIFVVLGHGKNAKTPGDSLFILHGDDSRLCELIFQFNAISE